MTAFNVGDIVRSNVYVEWEGLDLFVVKCDGWGFCYCSPWDRYEPVHDLDGSLYFNWCDLVDATPKSEPKPKGFAGWVSQQK